MVTSTPSRGSLSRSYTNPRTTPFPRIGVGDGVGVGCAVTTGVIAGVFVGDGEVFGVGFGEGVDVGVGLETTPPLYVTAMASVPVLPALSLAVTVMVLSPLERVMLETDHEVVPVAVPLPPLLLLHVTLLIPLALSNAVPSMLIALLVV